MSQWAMIQLELNDADAIRSALRDMRCEVETHQEAQPLVYSSGKVSKIKKAHLIVRRRHMPRLLHADLGFFNDGGVYKLMVDFEPGSSEEEQQKLLSSIRQLYGKHKVLKQVRRMGYTVASTRKTADGKLKIRVRI